MEESKKVSSELVACLAACEGLMDDAAWSDLRARVEHQRRRDAEFRSQLAEASASQGAEDAAWAEAMESVVRASIRSATLQRDEIAKAFPKPRRSRKLR